MDDTVDRLTKDFNDARASLDARFPKLRCLRCETDDFLLRVWADTTLQPGLSDNRIMELTCANCGFQETHMMAGLDKKLGNFVKLREATP